MPHANSCCASAAVVLAAAIALAGSIQQEDLADAIYGDGVSTGVHTRALHPCFKVLLPKQHVSLLACMLSCSHHRAQHRRQRHGCREPYDLTPLILTPLQAWAAYQTGQEMWQQGCCGLSPCTSAAPCSCCFYSWAALRQSAPLTGCCVSWESSQASRESTLVTL